MTNVTTGKISNYFLLVARCFHSLFQIFKISAPSEYDRAVKTIFLTESWQCSFLIQNKLKRKYLIKKGRSSFFFPQNNFKLNVQTNVSEIIFTFTALIRVISLISV